MKAAFLSVFAVLVSLPLLPANAAAPAGARALAVHGGTIFHFDFSDPRAWPGVHTALPSRGETATVGVAKVGTVDVANTSDASGGLLFRLKSQSARGVPTGGFVSGLIPVSPNSPDPALYTLSFSLSASSVRPVTVTIESFNSARQRTGGLTGRIYPAAPNFYQRYALDLAAMKPAGAGSYSASAPYTQVSFSVNDEPSGVPSQTYEMRLDNVNYASAAYFVSPTGDDKNDGRTRATAFATPQKALDVAGPGDIIDLMDGTFRAGQAPVADFHHPGLPDSWIVLKNLPGAHPVLTSTGWNIVGIVQGSREKFSDNPALAYIEIRGLHVRGEGDVARKKYADLMDKADSRTNSNGIAVDSRYSKNICHDIRIADNLIEFCPAGGIGGDADWFTVENNISRSNCWTTIYATSGISVAGQVNYDTQENVYKRLIRNNVCCHNQTYEKWSAINRYSDGNGIILDVNMQHDVNQDADAHPNSHYIGRSLVQSNLCYDNGGSGIHTVSVAHADIIGNTVYFNSASVHLEYSEMFTYGSEDVHFVNNIMVAPVANIAAGEKPEPVNACGGPNKNVVFSHNLYFGGNIPPTMGEGDAVGDPKFVKASIDDAVANFHLQPGSPAIGKGATTLFSPYLDLGGAPRETAAPSLGAYEKGK